MDKLNVSSVYLKISSDTKTIASYYSIDKKRWNMVRLYKNCYPKNIYLGISSQCPQKGSCRRIFLLSEKAYDLSIVLESIDNKEKNLALIFKNYKKEQVLSIFTKRFKSFIYNFSQKNPLQGIKRVQYFPHYILSLQCHQK